MIKPRIQMPDANQPVSGGFNRQHPPTCWEIGRIFLKLGLTSFGGPVAHLGYFRTEFVERRGWLSDQHYAELVALCQFLPGPASSQVGMAIGLQQRGYLGALAAWCGFTLPSALLLIGAAYLIQHLAMQQHTLLDGLTRGLKIVAVAVVMQALYGMVRTLCPDRPRQGIFIAAAIATLLLSQLSISLVTGQLVLMTLAALIGSFWLKPNVSAADGSTGANERSPYPAWHGLLWLGVFSGLLVGLPLALVAFSSEALEIIVRFYRAGAVIFGGGHVVLPLLQAETVAQGWLNDSMFLTGYGLAQAVPGPLFTFAAFLGAARQSAPAGLMGGLLALIAVFLPSFLLIAGTLPFWSYLRRQLTIQAALSGVNAAVCGLLLAALYDPVWTSAIHNVVDFTLLLGALGLLVIARWSPWIVVGISALVGLIIS